MFIIFTCYCLLLWCCFPVLIFACFHKRNVFGGNIMKKLLSLILVLYALSANSITAYASPQEAQDIEVKSFNFTQDCEYIEILMQLSEDSEDYTAYNDANMKKYSFDTKELSEYHDDDSYISLSCHFKDNYTRMNVKKQEYGEKIVSLNSFVLDDDKYEKSWHATDRMKRLHELNPKFKVAALDKNGSIIQTSEPFELENDSGYLWSYVNYDVTKNSIKLDWEKTHTPTQYAIRYYGIVIVVSIVMIVIIAKIGLLFVNRKKRKAQKELKQV